jgi:hypothetical protein
VERCLHELLISRASMRRSCTRAGRPPLVSSPSVAPTSGLASIGWRRLAPSRRRMALGVAYRNYR